MSSSRVIPASYVLTGEYVTAILGKIAGKPVADLPFSAENHAKLIVDGPKFLLEMNESSVALQKQMAATAVFLQADVKLDLYISAFFQVLNLGIRLEKFAATDRVFYKKAGDDNTVPDVRAEDDTERWAQNIIDGEAARVAAGGMPMPFPVVADIAAQLVIWKASRQTQSDLKEMAKKEGRDVADLLKPMVTLVMDIHDEINFTNRKLSAAAQRDISREYGMQYYSGPGDVVEETWTAVANAVTVVNSFVLADGNKLTLTIESGPEIKVCRDDAGCAEGLVLSPGTPLQITTDKLTGTGNHLVLNSGSSEDTVVKVRIEG